MAEKYGFFNDVDGDRSYYDDQLTLPFGAIAGSAGVVRNIGEELKPSIGTGMQIKVGAGLAFLGAMPGWWYQTTYEKTLNISAAQAGMMRVDTVVLRLDRNSAQRSVTVTAVQGTEAADSPSAPTLTKDETVYELAIANVNITVGTITGITDIRQFADIGNTEKVSIKNIAVDSGVVKGDFIYKDGTTWKIDNTNDQKLGTHIFDGKDAVCRGMMTWASDSGDIDYSLYVQSDGKLGLGTTSIVAAKILSADKVFIDFKPVNQKPKAYTDNMTQFFAITGPSGKVRLKIEMPATADGVYVYRGTSAYAGEGMGNWGTLVADVTDDSPYSGAFEWLEDDNGGSLLTNGTTYHYKAFPYLGSICNDTQGSNELYCRAGLLEHEYVPNDLSGGTLNDRVGSINLTTTNITLSPGSGKIADAVTGSAGYFTPSGPTYLADKTIMTWLNVNSMNNGLWGHTTDGQRQLAVTAANLFYWSCYASNGYAAIGSTGWHMLAGYWGPSGTTNIPVKLWSNDSLIYDQLVNPPNGVYTESNKIMYANLRGTGGQTFNSDADVIRIFSGYLVQNEIDMLYNGGAGC